MAFMDTVAAMAEEAKGPGCSIKKIRGQLDAADNATLTEVLESPRTSTLIAKALAAEGIRVSGKAVSAETVQRHRKGRCSCGTL